MSGPTGVLIQQHHYQARPAGETQSRSERDNNIPKENGGPAVMSNNHTLYQVDGKFLISNTNYIVCEKFSYQQQSKLLPRIQLTMLTFQYASYLYERITEYLDYCSNFLIDLQTFVFCLSLFELTNYSNIHHVVYILTCDLELCIKKNIVLWNTSNYPDLTIATDS